LALFIVFPDQGAMENAENERINFNLIMYKLVNMINDWSY